MRRRLFFPDRWATTGKELEVRGRVGGGAESEPAHDQRQEALSQESEGQGPKRPVCTGPEILCGMP